MTGQDRQKAEFNMGVSYLNRLNSLLYLCDDAAINLDATKWFHYLSCLFREISTELNDKEVEQYKMDITNINHNMQQFSSKMNRTGRVEIPADLYELLQDYELKLRKVLKDSGLQMKMKAQADFALE